MKNIFRSILSTLFVFSLLFTAAPVSADVNDFTISEYNIKLTLMRDDEKRSMLATEETIQANFPQADQNHGIERYIPKSYDGHSTGLAIISVTDANDSPLPYSTYDSGEYTVLRIGDKNTYVRGEQVYKIDYRQRDVTKHFADAGRDEFYWDTNGTEWRVPIERLNVSLAVDESLQSAQTGDAACYQGGFSATSKCTLVQDGNTMSTSATSLGRGENITLAVGFGPETFAIYQMSLGEMLLIGWIILQAVCLIAMFIIIFFLAFRYSKWAKRKGELGTIVPEYLPPQDASIQTSSTIVGRQASFSAQLIDFAVRHYIKIYETKPKRLFSNAEYEIEITKSPDDLRAEEQEFLSDFFKGSAHVGSKLSTKDMRKDYGLASRMLDNPKKLQALMRSSYGLQQKDETKSRWFKRFGLVLLVIAIILLSPPLLVASVVAFALGYTLWTLTDKGLELYCYLEGLKMYIGVAEADRLKMLQSPEGAAKTQVNGADQKQLVKLYERVLPYAILFGQEKEWNKRLGEYYDSTHTQPDWYTGATLAAFSAANFSSAMNNLTTSISSTGASYSSSGGSGGGGFSGGGGGGGGGGGW